MSMACLTDTSLLLLAKAPEIPVVLLTKRYQTLDELFPQVSQNLHVAQSHTGPYSHR
jgi:hypothetical protein